MGNNFLFLPRPARAIANYSWSFLSQGTISRRTSVEVDRIRSTVEDQTRCSDQHLENYPEASIGGESQEASSPPQYLVFERKTAFSNAVFRRTKSFPTL